MTPTEFAAGLADVMGIARTEIATVDRALAKAGLRQVARGRHRPDVTLKEGVQIVCAWAGARKLTDAAAEVKRLEETFPYPIPPDEYEMAIERIATNNTKTFSNLLGLEENHFYGQNFIQVISWLSQKIGSEKYPAEQFWVWIEKGGTPKIDYNCELKTYYLYFQNLSGNFPGHKSKSNVKISTALSGPVLKWIFDATKEV